MNSPDPNLDSFISNWPYFRNRLVIFLGAGASIGARNRQSQPLPNAYELRNNIWKKFKGATTNAPFDPLSLRLMSLEHAAAIVEAQVGRTVLSEYLTEVFGCDLPMWQHVALPYLNPKAIFTTNYDELIELGYKAHVDLVDTICEDREPVAGRKVLFKPHGSLAQSNRPIGKGGLVITQFDYFEMIDEYRKMLRRSMTGFNQACVLLIGYSFGDMDIGSELFHLRKISTGIPWYAVFPRSDAQVRKMYSNKLMIEQIDRSFEDFLVEVDDRIDFLPDSIKFKNKQTMLADGRIQ